MKTNYDAKSIASLIQSHRFPFSTESELQSGIETILARSGIKHRREVILDAASRIDFMAGSVGIEVKIWGTRNEVLRQLGRYAEFDNISALVLVSTKANHRTMPATLNGKPIHIASLLGGAF